MADGLRVQRGYTEDLDVVADRIKELVHRGIRDGESRQLAVQIVSGSYDFVYDRRSGADVAVVEAYGRHFYAPPGSVCPPRSDECEVERIWDFLVLNMRYVYDPKPVDTFVTLKQTLLAGGGDCDDASVAFGTLLGSVGFSVVGRIISKKETPSVWEHIYPMVGITKDDPVKWVPLDMTVDGAKPGWEYPRIGRHRDYLLV